MEILFASSNKDKIREIQSILGRPVHQVDVDLDEVQAIDVDSVIEHKAQQAFAKLGKPVLVEDTGLSLHQWNNLPGALIRWFMKTVGNTGFCKMLTAFDDLGATAKTSIGYYDGTNFLVFSGSIDGEIVREPRGDQGFGWDPIFQPNGTGKTFAEMTSAEKDAISMRKVATEKLRDYLDKNNL